MPDENKESAKTPIAVLADFLIVSEMKKAKAILMVM